MCQGEFKRPSTDLYRVVQKVHHTKTLVSILVVVMPCLTLFLAIASPL